jgi:hypothetical protein
VQGSLEPPEIGFAARDDLTSWNWPGPRGGHGEPPFWQYHIRQMAGRQAMELVVPISKCQLLPSRIIQRIDQGLTRV